MTPAPETAQLAIFGMLHDGDDTVILLGPHEPGFWQVFSASREFQDGTPHAMDRWSKRVIGALAQAWGGVALFPLDGPPYVPFVAWALASGQAWTSPIGMLVHARARLMVSYRGAVRVPGHLALPEPTPRPCDSCADRPCETACPVEALSSAHYDTALCHGHLNAQAGRDCMTQGCVARRACLLSASYGRLPQQSAFNMKAFHPT